MKILHIAPNNIAGVPITFVRAERALGHESRLVTLVRDWRGYEEDVCLNLPFLDFWGTRLVKRLVSSPDKLQVTNRTVADKHQRSEWRPNNVWESALVRLRECLWAPRVRRLFNQIDFWNFDVYQLDGGLEFFRDARTVRELHARGKKIVCCYTGSDLRTRGIIPEVDRFSAVNVTLEFDHVKFYPGIQHVLFPFEVDRVQPREGEPNSTQIRIAHAPTNRAAKGSEIIIRTVRELAQELQVELLLIENVSYDRSIELKRSCHIFVDQVGELGYGLNSLEALAAGIPTCSSLPDQFDQRYPGHPFVAVTTETLKEQLRHLIQHPALRRAIAAHAREWVEQNHDSQVTVRKIHALIGDG